jgi:transglutaminase-like putative cysteine protease
LEPTPVPASVTYDIEQFFKITNEGPSAVSTLRLTAAKIHSIDPFQEVISYEIQPALEYKEKSDELDNQYIEFEFINIKPGEERQFTIKYEVDVYREQLSTGLCEGELIPGYTQPEKYIESDAEEILSLAAQLSEGTKDVCQQVRAFYDYVAENLEYVPDCTREDYGALKALKYKSGDCTEFADLLIALTRSAGIPAQFIEGIVPDPGSEKHDWAQVYLPGAGWVTMEPTWGRIDGLREVYFAGTSHDHIILTMGRNLQALNNKHFWTSRFWWNNELSQPLVKIDSAWNVRAKE